MVNVNVLYTNRSAAKRFVDSCENSFKKDILRVCNSVISDSDLKIITLCGPTCSGKTTTSAILTSDLVKKGKRVKVISIDDFYFESNEMTLRNISNFESVDAIDLDCFVDVISKLINCAPTRFPIFDFVTKNRDYSEEYIPQDNDVYIIEGIQAMYPEISAILSEYKTKSIFISVAKDINICGVEFNKNEIRLIRRVVRDYFFRNSSADRTLELWKNVRVNEEQNIYPYANKADFIIDSLLPYEVFVISKYFLDITEGFPSSAYGYKTIESIRERLACLLGSSITSDLIPQDSVFREFII